MLEDVLRKVNARPQYNNVKELYNHVLSIEKESERKAYWNPDIPAHVVESLSDRYIVYRTRFDGVGTFLEFHDTDTMTSYRFDLVKGKIKRFELQYDFNCRILKFS